MSATRKEIALAFLREAASGKFRFQGDRIVELWDLGQPVPEKSPNENGMF